MSGQKKPKKISRRKFMRNVGTGIAGAYAVTVPVKNLTSQEEKALPGGAKSLHLRVNGKSVAINVAPATTLAELLRDYLGLTGTKISCNQAECGSCTVLLNNSPVYACHMLALDAEGKEVMTIEGLISGDRLHPLQQAFIDKDGFQCGFCTPGQILTAYALLMENPSPSEQEIKAAMSGNLCRCGAYPNIIKSVKAAATRLEEASR